jgi:WW domain
MSSSGSRPPTPGGKVDDTGPVTGAQGNASDDDDDDEVWDPAAEKHPRESSSSKGQDKTTTTTTAGTETTASASSSDWQAIWSAAHGAYYFYNTTTKETTWLNPLVPPSSSASDAPESTTTTTTTASDATAPANSSSSSGHSNNTSPPSQQPSSSSSPSLIQQQPSTTITAPSSSSFPSPSSHPTLPTAAQLGGIDPELAFLDPSLAYTTGGPNRGINTTGPVPTFTAKFNARSGRFAGGDARDPNHVSEYERAKRMSEAYFDVDSWKNQVEEREQAQKRAAEQGEDPNAKRKKPTKADLVRIHSSSELCYGPPFCSCIIRP